MAVVGEGDPESDETLTAGNFVWGSADQSSLHGTIRCLRSPGRVEVGVLDTSTVIQLGRIDDPATLPDECLISAITLAELSVGPHVANIETEHIARQAHLRQAENDFGVIAFDGAPARTFGAGASARRTAGYGKAACAYDALIAATAVANGLPLFTCNPGDFDGIYGLDLRVVPHPDAE